MIYYDVKSWANVLIRWRGTILLRTWRRILAFCFYATTMHIFEIRIDEQAPPLDYKHSYLFGHTLALLLVFRLNSSYMRYSSGRDSLVLFFTTLRNMVNLAGTLFRGGRGQLEWNRRSGEDGFSSEYCRCIEDIDDVRASRMRVDFFRWALALAISLKIHMLINDSVSNAFIYGTIKRRINWERMRLRTLMSADEFEEVDRLLHIEDLQQEEILFSRRYNPRPHAFHRKASPSWPRTFAAPRGVDSEEQLGPPEEFAVSRESCHHQTLLIVFQLLKMVRRTVAEPSSCKERFMQNFIDMATRLLGILEVMHQNMVTPLPFPYVSLLRTLLIMYFLCVPFFTSRQDGMWASICMPTLMALALVGIEEMGTELENPFGTDENDIDVSSMIASFEKDIVGMLELAGDTPAREEFMWLPVPDFIQAESPAPASRYLARVKEVAHMTLPKGPRQPGLRIKRVKLTSPTAPGVG
eukprot:TRINITY_DN14830_c0_g1_i1.p1 TRINITY_DN14830_c0_g1~~TRINITY_DN14830_c0_g1_i1.p1  ORF type:complete len:468 (-),score=65.63 TRINITY_DN14830_c0_g1_i1:244-1647(-)